MAASSFDAVAIVLPDPEFDNSPNARIVNTTLGYDLSADDTIRTLSANNPNNFDVIQGLLYVPDVTRVENDCNATELSYIPANVTRLTSFANNEYPFIALAPWTSSACLQSYLSLMRAEAVRAAIFYPISTSTSPTPSGSDNQWNIDGGTAWKDENQYPIYTLPGAVGAGLMQALAEYSGNMSSVPNGPQLTQIYDPRDTIRLFARMNVTGTAGIPSLWVFLIIVLAILLVIVILTSIVMHFVQRRQRRRLAQRVADGEVDLEALGIKRLNVPQEQLDKMPQYTYTSKDKGYTPVPGARQVPFTQPSCAICLDDFVHGETSVRELPCNHIFHPDCIDPFLRDNSSLCPMCKKSALAAGCPVQVTNLMVRRERLVRRMRERTMAEQNPQLSRRATMHSAMQRRLRGLSTPSAAVLSSRTNGTHVIDPPMEGDTEMQPMPTNTTGPQADATAMATAAGAVPPVPNTHEDMPAEVRAQGTSARRAWRMQRLARQQEQEYTEAAAEARAVDERRPLWRRIAGRFNSRWE